MTPHTMYGNFSPRKTTSRLIFNKTTKLYFTAIKTVVKNEVEVFGSHMRLFEVLIISAPNLSSGFGTCEDLLQLIDF